MNIIKKHCLVLLLTMLTMLASCSYDEQPYTYKGAV